MISGVIHCFIATVQLQLCFQRQQSGCNNITGKQQIGDQGN